MKYIERFNKWEWSGCIWMFASLLLISFISKSCANGPAYPLDSSVQESSETREEMTALADQRFYDPYSSERATAQADMTAWAQDDQNYSSTGSCPKGCIAPIDGCKIKGNISFDTSEKIYHLPGQEFYASTETDPEYGERWFCTEAEAIANGFRKSYR